MKNSKSVQKIVVLLALTVLAGCNEALVSKDAYKLNVKKISDPVDSDEGAPGGTGTTGGTTGGTGSSTTGGTGNGTGSSTTGGGGYPTKPTPPPNEKNLVKSVANSNPGMINDCNGRPVANNFLIYTVQALQKKDPRWGYMKKSGGKIPRDIVAFAWGGPKEGTRNFFVIDFVSSGCNNRPENSNFANPALSAKPFWKVHNADDGYADNGKWSANP